MGEEKIQAGDLTKKRDEKCVPLARHLLKLLTKKAGKIGSSEDAHQMKLTWIPAAKEALQLYLEADLTLDEVNYIHKLVLQAIGDVENLVVDSLNDSLTRLQKKLFDGKILSELSLKKMDNLLKTK